MAAPVERTTEECLAVLLEARMVACGVAAPRARELTAHAVAAASRAFPNRAQLSDQVTTFMDVMDVPCGSFLHTTMLQEAAAGRADIAQLVVSPAAKLRAVADDPTPRKKSLAHMYRGLCAAHRRLLETAGPEDAERLRALTARDLSQLVTDVERGAYNAVVQRCEQQDPTVMRSWDNPIFLSYYRERIAVLYGPFNVDGQLVRKFGLGFARRVLLGELAPELIGKMTARDIHPAGYKAEQDIIDVRRQQRVDLKVSTLFRCPGCGERRCNYREVQDRSADEPASIYCTCLNCGSAFQAS